MASQYRFTGTNIDITLVTDGTRDAQTFFVTDKIGEDANEIMAGIDIGIDYHTEPEFIQLAERQNLTLERSDARGTANLFMAGTGAARFVPPDGRLVMPSVNLASSGALQLPIEIRMTVTLQQQDFEYLAMNEGIAMYSTDATQAAFSFISIAMSRFGDLALAGIFVLNDAYAVLVNVPITLMADQDLLIVYRLEQDTGENDLRLTTLLNGNIIDSQLFGTGGMTVTSPIDGFVFTYGGVNGFGNRFDFSGIMRDLIVSAAGTELINVADPSTGTNTGSGGDGTPTDIVSV